MPKQKVETVTGNLAAITDIQREFLDHPDFVYFRKGEFANAVDVAWEVVGRAADALGIVVPVVTVTVALLRQHFTTVKQRLVTKPLRDDRDRRFIMCPDDGDPDPTLAAQMLEELGWKKKYIKPGQKGRLRFFVSGKEYFLFFRNPDNTFHGLRGSDKETISCLKGLFLDECG